MERSLDDGLRDLCEIWRSEAESVRRYDPDSPIYRVLHKVSEDLERVLGLTAPEWIPIATIEARTGWTRKTLRKRFLELAKERVPGTEIPLARRAPRWELHRHALDRIKPKPGRSLDVTRIETIQEIADRIGSTE